MIVSRTDPRTRHGRTALGVVLVVTALAAAAGIGLLGLWSSLRGRGWVEGRIAGLDPSGWHASILDYVGRLERDDGVRWLDAIAASGVLVASLLLLALVTLPRRRRLVRLAPRGAFASREGLEQAVEVAARSVDGVTAASGSLHGRRARLSVRHAAFVARQDVVDAVRRAVVEAVPHARRVSVRARPGGRRRVR